MRNPIEAMLWELCRVSRFEAMVRIGFLVGIVALIFVSRVTQDFSDMQLQVVNGILLMVIVISSVVTPSSSVHFDNQNAGFGFRLGYTRPVPTSQLVGIPLAFAALFAACSFLLPTLLANQLLSLSIPILGPICFVVCFALCFMAAVWSPTTIAGKYATVGCLAAFGLLFIGVLHQIHGHNEPILMAIGNPNYFQFGPMVYVVLLLIATSACVVTLFMVERQRHGERLIEFGLPSLWFQWTPSARKPVAFHSRFYAHCSFEFRRVWKATPLTSAVFTIPIFLATMIGQSVYPDWNGAAGLWIATLLMGPPAFQLLGTDAALGIRRKQGVIQYPAFDATRPLTNEEMITAKLLVTTACSAAGGLFILLAGTISLLLDGGTTPWSQLTSVTSTLAANVEPHWWLLGIVSLLLLYISSSSVIFTFGLWLPQRAKWLAIIAGLFYASMVLAGWDMHRGWKLYYLWLVYGYLLALAITTISAYILWRAYRTGALLKPLFLTAFALWLAYAPATLVLLANFKPESVSSAIIAPIVSLLLVPLASTAAAPLALASHRHA